VAQFQGVSSTLLREERELGEEKSEKKSSIRAGVEQDIAGQTGGLSIHKARSSAQVRWESETRKLRKRETALAYVRKDPSERKHSNRDQKQE